MIDPFDNEPTISFEEVYAACVNTPPERCDAGVLRLLIAGAPFMVLVNGELKKAIPPQSTYRKRQIQEWAGNLLASNENLLERAR